MKGNFIAEWFGHRVWPTVDGSKYAESNQRPRRCPFLSNATAEDRLCIKIPRIGSEPTGVCTISSDSNGPREDWLACPYRILDRDFKLLVEAVRTLYRLEEHTQVMIFPVTSLHQPDTQGRILYGVKDARTRVFAFSAEKLGGEVDIPETDASPGGKVDVSLIEILDIDPHEGKPSAFGQHVFFEIQTADFHGSPLHAVRLLAELCSQSSEEPYHDRLRTNVEICGTGVEGPNKANIFKRTLYQIILKIQMARHPSCAGFIISLPAPVWTSWLRHLAFPVLHVHPGNGSIESLPAPGENPEAVLTGARFWLFVFDIDRNSDESPQPLRVVKRIATTADALMHQALTAAAVKGIEAGVIEHYRNTLQGRVMTYWRKRPRGL